MFTIWDFLKIGRVIHCGKVVEKIREALHCEKKCCIFEHNLIIHIKDNKPPRRVERQHTWGALLILYGWVLRFSTLHDWSYHILCSQEFEKKQQLHVGIWRQELAFLGVVRAERKKEPTQVSENHTLMPAHAQSEATGGTTQKIS